MQQEKARRGEFVRHEGTFPVGAPQAADTPTQIALTPLLSSVLLRK